LALLTNRLMLPFNMRLPPFSYLPVYSAKPGRPRFAK
jgi:hypothetical protein